MAIVCWVFFAFLGITSLVKGIGFGTVLTLAIVTGVLLWQGDIGALRRLQFPGGWVLTVVLTLSLAALEWYATR